ncbi:MAG: ATPase, T2SS/T4P/T4SS family [Candidatus Omnitrophota bacterium]
MAKTLKEKILDSLIELKSLKKEDVDSAVTLQKSKGISLEKALIEKGLVTEQEFLILLVKELNIPPINLAKYKIDPGLQQVIPERISRQYHVIPISELGHTITIAVSDPFNIFAIDDLKSITGRDIDVTISTETEILQAIDNFYGTKKDVNVADVTKDITADGLEVIGEQQSESAEVSLEESEQAPIVKMVDLVIKEALRQRASDIHIEPTPDNMRVRYRVDGILNDILNIPKANQNAVIVRIKIMSRLDITETRIPQDGRFKMRVANKEVDFRVSLLPTTFGQKIVMRILDKSSLSIGLEGLGFFPDSVEHFKEAIAKPFGMILITGPTGSGKSTTLYSIVNKLNTVDRNIVTVEDPVEYLVEGLTQVHVRADIGLTFSSGLRSLLRQSPDIIMVGEIRDSETADIAIKASLTGQLVFSTLHTNDAPGALTRLVDMGVEPFLVASSLVMVCAQRLCRKICSKCKEPVNIPDSALKSFKHKIPKDAVFYHGKGCDNCKKTGYRGRMGVLEMFAVDDPVREMLVKGCSSGEIKDYAVKEKGMLTLFDDAFRKFTSGMTTLEEVLRVTSEE